jgi:very-short-patch-repair endonuclease
MVKELYTNCEFQFKVFNYSLDVALPDKKIAIEFDGYFHFDCEKNKEYYKNRQKRIEDKGWKFLKYTMFDKFPSLEKLKEDIENLKNSDRTNNK